jgi:hypothetical protein
MQACLLVVPECLLKGNMHCGSPAHQSFCDTLAFAVVLQGETNSYMVMNNTVRVKPACQPAQDVLLSAQSFARVSDAFPPNTISLLDSFCFTATVSGPEPQRQCYEDALHADHFSFLASYQDPDKGSQFPGYVLYMANVTRVCINTISQQCLQDTNGDEELCMAMLVASGPSSQLGKPKEAKSGGTVWTHGAVAGVAVAGGWWRVVLENTSNADALRQEEAGEGGGGCCGMDDVDGCIHAKAARLALWQVDGVGKC